MVVDMSGKKKEMISTLLYFLCVLGLTALILVFVGQRAVVDGSSMESTLSDGDNLIVEKVSYRFRDPERFDIIVFPYKPEDRIFIKRIIGLPGETVRIDEEGNIYIDGEVLEEHYGREVIAPERIGVAKDEITLGEDEYFVMGDNRNDSKDSRTAAVGNIKRGDIIGRVFVRVWPPSKIGLLKHQ